MAAPTSSYEKTRPLEAGETRASSGTSSLRSRFENMAKSAEEESRRQAEEDRVRQQARECQAARRKEAKREDEETPPTLPPRPADLGEELCKIPSQDQPTYSEILDVGGDYEELPEPSDYCDSTNGGADYEELPAPLGKLDTNYDHGGDGGEDYEEILPEEPSQSQPHLGEPGDVYEVESPGTCAVALYDYQGRDAWCLQQVSPPVATSVLLTVVMGGGLFSSHRFAQAPTTGKDLFLPTNIPNVYPSCAESH
ncbi:src substrate protein p85-like [Harpia harpyja]|uniref:src substrate protein p85-like n=1 Tax=Harpia harpyja TaxID=202280 RepID=UPI0022B1F418|nr:src substrate protein p85-like [Harpia harpyja]